MISVRAIKLVIIADSNHVAGAVVGRKGRVRRRVLSVYLVLGHERAEVVDVYGQLHHYGFHILLRCFLPIN